MINVMAFHPAKDWPHLIMGTSAKEEDMVGNLENWGSDMRSNGQLIGQSDL